jgi:acyl-CoA dehydrogenase
MADLVLTEDHKQYQDLARDFSKNEIAPRAHQFDHSGEFPEDLGKKAWEIGLFNVRVPEVLGGLGLGVWDACIMAEEIGAGCVGIGSAIWANDMAVSLVLAGATDQQNQKLVEP